MAPSPPPSPPPPLPPLPQRLPRVSGGPADRLLQRAAGSLTGFLPLTRCAGYWIKDYFVFFSNQPGMLMGLFYIFSGYGCAGAKTRKILEVMFLSLAFLLTFVGMLLALPFSDQTVSSKKFVWGMMVNGILLVYYAAPLSTVAHVFKTQSASSLYFPLCAMNLLNGVCWAIYAMAIGDYFILVPNGIGAALAVFQVGLIFWFRGNQSLVQVLSLGPHVKGKSSGGLGRSASTENMLGRGAQSGGAGDSGTQA